MFHSHLIYGLIVYTSANHSSLKSIELKQKKAIRYVTGAKYNAHTGKLFKETSILPFEYLLKFRQLTFMYDFKNNILPRSFSNLWVINAEFNNRYNLRNNNDYRIPFHRIELVKRFPICRLPKVWNEFLDANIKNLQSRPSFKSKLKKYLLSEISSICNRLLCPTCHLNL